MVVEQASVVQLDVEEASERRNLRAVLPFISLFFVFFSNLEMFFIGEMDLELEEGDFVERVMVLVSPFPASFFLFLDLVL